DAERAPAGAGSGAAGHPCAPAPLYPPLVRFAARPRGPGGGTRHGATGMTSTDQHIARAGVAELARGIARGEYTPAEVTDVFLRRIQDLNPAIGAFVAVYEDEARQAARQATQALAQGQRLSPLHGIPFAVKDIVDVAGKFTTYGSRTGAGRQAGATA